VSERVVEMACGFDWQWVVFRRTVTLRETDNFRRMDIFRMLDTMRGLDIEDVGI